MVPINLADFEQYAQKKLSRVAYDYYASGAHDEITLRENHEAFNQILLRYRVLRDISHRDLSTTLLKQAISMPVIISPTAFQKMAHSEGETATAKAAANAKTIMILSTLSTTSIEDVMTVAEGPVWFQLYVYKDRGATAALIERAEAAGCSALVLTVDAQIWGCRESDVRNHFQLPPGLSVQNLMGAGKQFFPKDTAGSGLSAYVASLFDTSLSWKDLEWLCAITRLPILLKGIVHPDDALLAVDSGASGVIVSNHGGRQLDTSPPTIAALPAIAAAVGDHVELILDGGIRRGTDVIKALALGAKAVGIGRPVLWGLSHAGQKGVESVLDILRNEIDLAMGLCGCSALADIRSELLMAPPQ